MDTTFQTYVASRMDAIREAQVATGLEVSEILRIMRASTPPKIAIKPENGGDQKPESRWKPLATKILFVSIQSASGVYAIFQALKSGDIGTALSTLSNLASNL